MNYNPSPKSEFMKDAEAVKAHHILVENDHLRKSLDVSLRHMSRLICNNAPADNMGACASAHLRMLGAQDFLSIFLNLAEADAPEARKDTANLPSNVSTLPTATQRKN